MAVPDTAVAMLVCRSFNAGGSEEGWIFNPWTGLLVWRARHDLRFQLRQACAVVSCAASAVALGEGWKG